MFVHKQRVRRGSSSWCYQRPEAGCIAVVAVVLPKILGVGYVVAFVVPESPLEGRFKLLVVLAPNNELLAGCCCCCCVSVAPKRPPQSGSSHPLAAVVAAADRQRVDRWETIEPSIHNATITGCEVAGCEGVQFRVRRKQ